MTLQELLAQYGTNPFGARGQLYQQGREADAAQAGLGYYTPQSEGTGTFRYNDPRFNEAGRFTDPNGQMMQLVGQYIRRNDGAAPNLDDAQRLFNDPNQVQYDPDFGFYTNTDNFKPNQEGLSPMEMAVMSLVGGAGLYGIGATGGFSGANNPFSGMGGGSGAGGGAGGAGGYSSLPTMPYNPAAPALNPMSATPTFGGSGFGATGSAGGGLFGGSTPSVSQLAGNAIGAPSAATGMFVPGGAQSIAQLGANAAGAGSGMLSAGSTGLLGTIQNYASGMLDNAMQNPMNAIRGISGLTNMIQGMQEQPSNGGGKSGGGDVPRGAVQRPQYTPNPYTQQQLQNYRRLGI